MSLPRTAPTGAQVRLVHHDQHGEHELWSVAVAAGLRTYTVGGRSLLDGYPASRRPDGGRGQTLVPWPNRIAGARYSFDGVEQQLPITEPATGNAIHGLARWVAWDLLERTLSSVTWGHVVPPQPGWPTSLACRVTHTLGEGGLTVTTSATNTGDAPCPYGTGTHPYLAAGGGLVDDLTLQVPARTCYEVDDSGIPVGTHDVEGTDDDLRTPTRIGSRVLDTCYGDVQRDADGRWRVVVAGPGDQAPVTLWGDRAYDWVQVFSGDTLPEPARRRGLAVEAMTCPPNAFNSGTGLVRLEPGQSHTATWGLTLG